jgi:glutathione synthase/RimK-type ligase-like ATP-grasp enzyme
MRVALATWHGLPDLTEGDRALATALRGRGVDPVPAVWSAPLDWAAFDAVVIRSCWDYHRRHTAFLAWVTRLDRAGIPVVNPPELLRWNAHKGYLAALVAGGIPVVPTIAADRRELAGALADARARGWRKIVVKPAVSASAEGVVTLALRGELLPSVDHLADGDYLVQPVIDALLTDGEINVIYFGGSYSHAVRRAHYERGGAVKLVEIPPHVRAAADRVVAALPRRPAYCRVDLVQHDGAALLMEVELIEPDLWVTLAPDAPARFADAVLDAL